MHLHPVHTKHLDEGKNITQLKAKNEYFMNQNAEWTLNYILYVYRIFDIPWDRFILISIIVYIVFGMEITR